MTRDDYVIIWGITAALCGALVLTYLAMYAIASFTGAWT